MGAGASTTIPPGTLSETTLAELDKLPDAAKKELAGLASNLSKDADLATTNVKLLFEAMDADKSGSLDAEEVIAALSGLDSELDIDAINALLREADTNGDGVIQEDEFEALLAAPPELANGEKPHLVLNFDVNQTVMILDSAIKAEPVALLNTILSNCAWGTLTPGEGDAPPTWALASTEPSLAAPSEGLKTYLQYAVALTPIPKDAPLADVKAAKAKRRTLIQTFTTEGPGAPIAPFVAKLTAALEVPPEVLEKADKELLESVGLGGGACLLLPSFLNVLRELKRQKRSFSVCFRTFGKDLPKLAPEYNALCSKTHPLFAFGPLADANKDVVLDGTDGAADLRMDMESGSKGCGTWLRVGDASTGGDEGTHLLLVLGSIEQPPLETVTAGVEAIDKWYKEAVPAGVEIVVGAKKAAARLATVLHQPGKGCTLALRDYYPGWEASGCRAEGGKPLLLEPASQGGVLQLFFDDHVNYHDAHIVDVRRAAHPTAPALPIGAVLGIHLLRAEPLHSIANVDYFVEVIAAAETKWLAACARRRRLAAALLDKGKVVAQIEAAKGAAGGGEKQYVAHEKTKEVASAPDVNAADDDENA